MNLKIIVSTSDAYLHIMPAFVYFFTKNWSDMQPVEVVGYERPPGIPAHWTFVSMGKQRGKEFFSDDLWEYFNDQPAYFVWLMEDTFIKNVSHNLLTLLMRAADHRYLTGKVALTNEFTKRPYSPHNELTGLCVADETSGYLLSTQPAIWAKHFLLEHLTPGLNPWEFETQKPIKGWRVIGSETSAIEHNEGVRRFDLYKFDLAGFSLNDLRGLYGAYSDVYKTMPGNEITRLGESFKKVFCTISDQINLIQNR